MTRSAPKPCQPKCRSFRRRLASRGARPAGALQHRGRRGEVCSTDGLSFHVDRRQTLGIVGESGSGKSVTSMAVMGLHTAKNTRIAGIDQARRPRARRHATIRSPGKRMAMIFQDPAVRRPLSTPSATRSWRPTGSTTTSRRRWPARMRSRCSTGSASRSLTAARRRLPAPVLRRHASARDDRNGIVLRPGAADCPTSRHGTRRHRPGADPRPDPRPAEGVQLRRRDHHPRPAVVAELADDIMVMYAGRAAKSTAAPTRSSMHRNTPPGGSWGSMPRFDKPPAVRLLPIRRTPPA